MICGTGVDIVDITRFQRWSSYPEQQLLRIFGQTELDACKLESGLFTPEKLATRFAAKEAFFKALCSTLASQGKTKNTFHFLSIAPLVCVTQDSWSVPTLSIDWKALEKKIGLSLTTMNTHLSLSHEKTHAVAFVIITNAPTCKST